jgi:serine/threonine protein kinase
MNLTKLGRFEILREIGKGAMGQVFLAHDPKIERQVAIKTIVLPPGTSQEEAQETSRRFLREAQAAGRLLHPNIVTIFDVGEDGGVSFIAMEFIEGETLEKYTRPGSLLPLWRVHDVISQTAAALDYAHQHHIVHRDIKPANLMLLRAGVLKVTDFGLAKSPSANLTQAGVLLGTPSYMSPEQIQGQDLDGRSDIFSLGVVLYELLTGTRPFEGDSISTIIYRVLYEDPRPPAVHNPALPPEMNLIVERALAKEPGERYATAAALVADLEKALAGLPPESLSRPLHSVAGMGAGLPSTLRRPASGRRPGRPDRSRPGLPFPAAPPVERVFIARHPVKVAAVLLTAALGLVLFPRWVNRHERHPVVAEENVPDIEPGTAPVAPAAITGGFAGAGVKGAPPEGGTRHAALTGGQVMIEVSTIPHGGAIFLDSTPLAQPRIVLSRSDPSPHDIVARAGCRQAVAEMTAADLSSYEGALVLELKPRREEVLIGSEPPGARVSLNGRDTGKVTPAGLSLGGCEERSLSLDLEGYRSWRRDFDADDDFDAMIKTLKSVPLEPIPEGTLLVKKPPEYGVEVFAGDRRLGEAGKPIALKEGKYSLTFKNDKVFVRETVQVVVAGGRTATPLVALPPLGTLTVHAQPSNCKVYVDGAYVDVTPVLEMPIASGAHRVKVVFVPNGAEQEKAITIEGKKNTLVTVKF